MRALLQRVTKASVSVAGETVGKIRWGLVVLVGVATDDTDRDIDQWHDVHCRGHHQPQ